MNPEDHRSIGIQQELFFFHEHSPGSCFFLPHGTRIFTKLQGFLRKEYFKRGFQEVMTPVICKDDLWLTSGHFPKFKPNMFCLDVDETEYAICPMNCPKHCLMYKFNLKSYKDLPIRYADFGVLHRNEASGALSGLFRGRKFHQDDAHIFCTDTQVGAEMDNCINFLNSVYTKFGFEFELTLSTRPDEFIGSLDLWAAAEQQLKDSLDKFKKPYNVDEKGGAFYGPKIDVHIKDAFKKKHQCATIQLDFQLPIRFDLKYKDEKDESKTPVIIHRAIYGSFERFIGILCEHYQGNWPFWLSPRQIIVLPVSEKFMGYAQKVTDILLEHNYYTDLDKSSNTVSKKIREAEVSKYNYILVVGEKEENAGTVNVRYRDQDKKVMMTLQELLDELKKVDH
jgi:threonyl-tRNA synthetase